LRSISVFLLVSTAIIDMRSIAPTIAQILGSPLPKAEVAPLDVVESP